MGEVYRARDARLGREVAIKVLSSRVRENPESHRRFQQEALAIGRLSDPNVLAVFDVGDHEGYPYLVTELLHGRTLRQRLGEGPLTIREAVDCAAGIARALSATHRLGVVHRDLKPENVFVTAEGGVKVLDFGLAKSLSPAADPSQGTASGAVLGTVGYMSPEQVRGEAADPRSDLFSLGAVLYEMLCGRRAFQRDSAVETLHAILHDPPPDFAAAGGRIPPALERVVRRCLEKRPEDRYQSADQVAAALGECQDAGPVSLPSLLAELTRRRVFRALVAYGIAAFAVLQIIEPIMHGLHWPDRVLSYVVVALALGFPVVVSLAWIFDVKAGRIERTAPVAPASGLRGVRLAAVLIAVGLAAAAPGTIYFFVGRVGARETSDAGGKPTARMASIAVLPFADMSSGKDQEYFSDGLSEEILNALAQLDGLQVTGRTSSFAFKGKSEGLAAIASKLHVATVLEGSVRREGNRVRITAQLVNASDGYHLWSQTYDREMTGIFAVQDEIAAAVVEALKVKLLPGKRAALARARVTNFDAYTQYLRARQLYNRQAMTDAIAAYQKTLALDPGYVPALADLTIALTAQTEFDRTAEAASAHELGALAAADRAVELAPEFAGSHAARGFVRCVFRSEWKEGLAEVEHALSINPRDENGLRTSVMLNVAIGRPTAAIVAARSATEVDPLSAESWTLLGFSYVAAGELRLARHALDRSIAISPQQVYAYAGLGRLSLLERQPTEALKEFELSTSEMVRLKGKAMAEHDLGHARDSDRALNLLIGRYGHNSAAAIAEVFAWRGENDRALTWLERGRAQNNVRVPLYLKFVIFEPRLRGDPRYAALLQEYGLPAD